MSVPPLLDAAAVESWTATLSDTDVVALTIWGEARGEDPLGRRMVGSTIVNRIRYAQAWERRYQSRYWWGHDPRSVCLAHDQFDCWMAAVWNRENLAAMRDVVNCPDAVLGDCRKIAAQVMAGTLVDSANGATHYLNPADVADLPSWANPITRVASHGRHVFYRVIDREISE